MTKAPKRTREQKRLDRLAAIKQAAVEVFAEHGYHAAKVSQIVARVGVAQGTFYLYYDGKKPIFGEVLSDFLMLLVNTVSDWEPREFNSLEEVIGEVRNIGIKLADALFENKLLTKIYFREAIGVDPEFDEMIREFYEVLEGILINVNTTLYEKGLIKKMNFQLISVQTIGMVEKIIEEFVVNESLIGVTTEEVVDHLIANFMTGTRVEIPTSS